MPKTDPVALTPTLWGDTGFLIFVGAPTVVATTTIGSLTAKNIAAIGAYPAGLLQANAGAAAAAGTFVVNTTRSNSSAWVDSVSSGISVLSQPMASNVGTWSAVPAEDNGWVNGNTVTLNTLPTVYMSAFNPVPATIGGFSADDYIGAFLGHVHIADPTTTPFPTDTVISTMTMVSECLFDTTVLTSSTVAFVNTGTFINNFHNGNAQFDTADAIAGVFKAGLVWGGKIDANPIVHGNINTIVPKSALGHDMGEAYLDQSDVFLDSEGFIGAGNYSNAVYGNYAFIMDTSTFWTYQAPAATTFRGAAKTGRNSRVNCFFSAFANAVDRGVKPAQWYPARPLDVPALDLSVSNGGFGGEAHCDGNGTYIVDLQQSIAAPAAYLNAGTGISITQNSPGSGQVTVASTSASVPACGQFQLIEHDNASGYQCGPAPGANGNVVTSNGTSWVSQAPGGGFTCSNLNPCQGGQLPPGGISNGSAGQILVTNSAANGTGWGGLLGDVTISSVSGTNLTDVLSAIHGTPIVLSGVANGDLFTFITGTGWTNRQPVLPIPVISGIGHASPAVNVPTAGSYGQITSVTLTVPAAAVATIDCKASIEWAATIVSSQAHTLAWGIAQDSTAAPTDARGLLANAAASNVLGGAMVERYPGTSGGAHTYYVLAQDLTASGTSTLVADLDCIQH